MGEGLHPACRVWGGGALEAGVVGLIDNAHSSAADFFKYLIVRDGRPNHDDFLLEGRQHLQRKRHRCVGRMKQLYKANSVRTERQIAREKANEINVPQNL